ncbi:MAG: anthranilate synthase component II [Bacteroidota bacterium]
MESILVLDNYDSFTYNLVHLLESIADHPVVVKRNDAIDEQDLRVFKKLILSPGPGLPQEAGRMMDLLAKVPDEMPVLGVCLGMQALALHTGGNLFQLTDVQHGIDTRIQLEKGNDRLGLYQGLPAQLTVGRYHSWMVSPENLPTEWLITAVDQQNRIMSMTHAQKNWQGVQYHPESVLTPDGRRILQNWLQNG